MNVHIWISDLASPASSNATNALLHGAVENYLSGPSSGWRLERTDLGKPIVTGLQFPLAISVSHTPNLLTCAVANVTRVGIDIEELSRPIPPLESLFNCLPANEHGTLRQVSPAERSKWFLSQWVSREAAAKADGVGLSQDLRAYHILQDKHGLLIQRSMAGDVEAPSRLLRFHLRSVYVGALVVPDSSKPLKITAYPSADDLQWTK